MKAKRIVPKSRKNQMPLKLDGHKSIVYRILADWYGSEPNPKCNSGVWPLMLRGLVVEPSNESRVAYHEESILRRYARPVQV